jgi:hypothetical protein
MMTVERMLDFYRPSAEFKPVNILDLLEHVLNLLGTAIARQENHGHNRLACKIAQREAISNQLSRFLSTWF